MRPLLDHRFVTFVLLLPLPQTPPSKIWGSFRMPCSSCCARIRSCLSDYDRLQSFAVLLIYAQIGCALIGSLGALFNGILLINLVVALFALVAIESSSQTLGRTYAVLLGCSVMLDISWFILFSHTIWNYAPDEYGKYFVFSLRLALVMQIIGFSVRISSTFLWIQMYKLGVVREADVDVRNSFINPPVNGEISRQNSVSDVILGGSIYDPSYYSSLFGEVQDKAQIHEDGIQCAQQNHGSYEVSQVKTCLDKALHDVDNSLRQPLNR